MKSRLLLVLIVLVPMAVQATEDPILFTVGDMPVTRSEFEKSYLKTVKFGQEGCLSLSDFLKSYIVYKLKVKAALDAHLDKTNVFQTAYAQCMSGDSSAQMISVSSGKLSAPTSEVVAHYERLKKSSGTDGMICLSQIFIPVPQKANREEQRKAEQRIEEIYRELQGGAEFSQIARRYSQDRQSSDNGGVMGWYCRGQLFKEIEDAAFKLKKGEMSRPFLSTIGYHILLVNDRKSMEEYDVVKERLSDEVGRRKIHQQTTATAIMGQPLVKENAAAFAVSGIQEPTDPLQQEYYEGLLLIEQSKQSVGRRAAEDEEALRYYFKKNKKKYRRKGFKPKDYTEVRELVVADLQEEMNKHWVADLRKQYPVKVNKKVLKTVNNHR